MPIGVIVNSLGIFVGGLLGGSVGKKLSREAKESLTMIFGLCAFLMAVVNMIALENLPAVVLSLIVGLLVGMGLRFDEKINQAAAKMERWVAKVIPSGNRGLDPETYFFQLTTIIVLFCASGTGIYGSLESGMTGDHGLLITKTLLDFFTAMIFSASLGPVVSFIAVPQAIVFLSLFYAGEIILAYTTLAMIADFKAVGGVLILASALNILELKRLPVTNMIPAMAVSLPISYLWITYLAQFF